MSNNFEVSQDEYAVTVCVFGKITVIPRRDFTGSVCEKYSGDIYRLRTSYTNAAVREGFTYIVYGSKELCEQIKFAVDFLMSKEVSTDE